jgi:hypothetical protein
MKKNGWYLKYYVTKVDGGEVESCADYFVLRLDTDPHARTAACAYASAVEEENPQLARDLRERCGGYALEAMDPSGDPRGWPRGGR